MLIVNIQKEKKRSDNNSNLGNQHKLEINNGNSCTMILFDSRTNIELKRWKI